MATIEEMCDVIDNMNRNNDKWLLGLLMETPKHLECSVVADVLVRALLQAEDNRRRYNDGYGDHNIPCTYWLVGDYIIIYLTNNWEFHADMLTEDMMNDLIIEVAA